MVDPSNEEAFVEEFLKQGKKEEAIKLLLNLIKVHCKTRNFPKAEALRQKIFQVDSMALTEIIQANELIEDAKSQARDQNHFKVWPKLYNTLSEEEGNALYYALEKVEYQVDDAIFEQGKMDRNLYFIDYGELKEIYRKGDRELLLRTIKPGHFAGVDNFFAITVCTSSLVALSRVTVHTLSNDTLAAWEKDYPGLESKLRDFCQDYKNVHQLVEEKGVDRRELKRYPFSSTVEVRILNLSGQPVGTAFKGKLADISQGGLSFYIRTTKKETARLLLGRALIVDLDLPTAESSIAVSMTGKVIGVGYHLFNDYSVHLTFETMLSSDIIENIERLSRQQS